MCMPSSSESLSEVSDSDTSSEFSLSSTNRLLFPVRFFFHRYEILQHCGSVFVVLWSEHHKASFLKFPIAFVSSKYVNVFMMGRLLSNLTGGWKVLIYLVS